MMALPLATMHPTQLLLEPLVPLAAAAAASSSAAVGWMRDDSAFSRNFPVCSEQGAGCVRRLAASLASADHRYAGASLPLLLLLRTHATPQASGQHRSS